MGLGHLTAVRYFTGLLVSLFWLTSCQHQVAATLLKDLAYGSHPRQTLDLYLPKTEPSQPLPLLIYLHGGGWLANSKELCPGEIVAQRGYAIACINYRYSTDALFPAQIQDAKRAVRWLRANGEKYGLDPDRFGAWGDSAGGHLSALLGTSAGVEPLEGENSPISSQVQAVCNWYGPTDFTQVPPAFEGAATPAVVEAAKKQQKPWFAYTVATTKLLGGPVAQKRELAASANPIRYIDASDPPFLIVHGELDRVVPIGQSDRLAEALRRQGVSVEFVRLPDLNHSYEGKNGERFDPELIEMALNFFDRQLNPVVHQRNIHK